MIRATDATVHNAIANHPDVVRSLEWNPDDGPLLFGNLLDAGDHYILLHNGARDFTAVDADREGWPVDHPTLAMIFEWSAPGVYQMHTMSLPGTRGAAMMRDAKTMVRAMFVNYRADMLWGQTPLANRPARMFNRLVGGKSCGFGHHHIAGEVEYFRNSRARWLADHAPV